VVIFRYITKQQLFTLKASDSLLPKAYGLPKVHKKEITFRIIISSVNSTCYSFANFLHKILHTSLPLPNSHVKNSFELYKILNGFNVPSDYALISLDVKSLFTNIPGELVMESINSRWVHIESNTKIPKKRIYGCYPICTEFYFFYVRQCNL